MKTTPHSRGVRSVCMLVALTMAASVSAQNLAVLKASNLDAVFDGIEAVSEAAGEPVERQMMLDRAAGMLGTAPTEFLALDRPIAVVMPVEGMMLQQNGLVAAVPVTDPAAAIEALESVYETHAVEEGVHVFSNQQMPVLYMIQTGDTLRLGGNRGLVTGFDPLAGGGPADDLELEIFLEPVAPMITAGLEAGRSRVEQSLRAESADNEEMPYDPEALGPMLDVYFDWVQSLVNNTSSLRLGFNVDDGYLRTSGSLVAKEGSSLAAFFAAQKGGLPRIVRVADPDAAMFAAGSLTLDDETRQIVKDLTARYLDAMTDLFTAQPVAAAEQGGGDETAEPDSAPSTLWSEYIDWMGRFSDRWVDCWNGDMAMSFEYPADGSFSFVEGFGLRDEEACQSLIADMSDELGPWLDDNRELAEVVSVEDGPGIAGSRSTLVTLDMVKWADALGQSQDPHVDQAITRLYGEKMTIAMASAGGSALITGGGDAAASLDHAFVKLGGPGSAPSFAPLKTGPGVWGILNLGRFIAGMNRLVPDDEVDFEVPARTLSGDAGRIPMGIRFDAGSATFHVAVSLKTIEAIAEIAEQERAEAAAAASVTTAEGDGGD